MADTPEISPPPTTGSWIGELIKTSGQTWNEVSPYVQEVEDAINSWAVEVAGASNIDNDFNLNGKDFTLGQNKYDFTQRVFPLDLGQPSYHGHYMVININVSNYSQFNGQIYGPAGSISTFNKLNNELSKVDALRSSIDKKYTSVTGESLKVGYYAPRQTRRIAESIALFMPTGGVIYEQHNQDNDVSLTEATTNVVKSMVPLVAPVINIGQRALNFLHMPINPRTEVIFAGTAMREFRFNFLLAPTNEAESAVVEQIIKTLRFHAAPEFNGLDWKLSDVRSLLWIPPSEFDITFYNRGKENLHLPKINTCVLKDISVDFAPSGIYSTFSNGYPVAVALSLNFLETEVIHKLRVAQGF